MVRPGAGLRVVCVAALAAGAARGARGAGEPGPATIAPSVVEVRFHLQYADGEAPQGSASWPLWRAGHPFDPLDELWEDFSGVVQEERPLECAGYLVSPARVCAADPMIHPRFVRRITVRAGGREVEAAPAGFALMEGAMVLEVAEPLPGARELRFDPDRPGPYWAVTRRRHDGRWADRVAPVTAERWVPADGPPSRRVPPGSVIVDYAGVPVGLTFLGELPEDGSWKGDPLRRPSVSAAEAAAAEDRVRERADCSLLRVSLRFRSPRGGTPEPGPWGWPEPEGENETEWNGLGVLVREDLLLVTANLNARRTGRLEEIRVFTADGASRGAAFAGTLARFGGLLARLEEPLPGPAVLCPEPVLHWRNRLLVLARIAILGESRMVHFGHERLGSFHTSWDGLTWPAYTPVADLAGSWMGDGEARALNVLFDLEGRLVGLPMERRLKVTVRDDVGEAPLLVPASILSEILAGLDVELAADHGPLAEDQESRIAWLGVELQALDPQLAREQGVADRTGGGATGAVVTCVYPGSPASAAGLREGDILLRLHVEGHPRPLEIDLSRDERFGAMEFWDQIDEIPEEYFEHIPAPWGSVENTLTRALTDLGFGTPFAAEVFSGGEVRSVGFVVTESPPHFESAPRFRSRDLGLTVRDLTYEVRRHYRLGDEDPGVVVSKIEPGGKAAVAGLKPYEIVTAVGETQIRSVADFESAVAPPGEHRLHVKRMSRGRIVKITSSGAER